MLIVGVQVAEWNMNMNKENHQYMNLRVVWACCFPPQSTLIHYPQLAPLACYSNIMKDKLILLAFQKCKNQKHK